MTTRTREDVYTRVTSRIVADLEQGTRPWLKPWHASNAEDRITLPLRHNGKPYRGVNVLLLWGEAMGYTAPTWMTYKQAQRGAPAHRAYTVPGTLPARAARHSPGRLCSS